MTLGKQRSSTDDESDINLTPMLDVVFIMLIFFIVTATFIKQTGADPRLAEAVTSKPKPTVSVLVGINANGDIMIDKKRVDPDHVRAQIERLHAENPKGDLVIKPDVNADFEKIRVVLNAARGAKIPNVSLATEPD